MIESGSQQKFSGSTIICQPVFLEAGAKFGVTLFVQDTATTSIIAQGSLQLTTAEVDAETGSGSGETAIWFNALQKAAVTKLSAMSGNGSTTFTVV